MNIQRIPSVHDIRLSVTTGSTIPSLRALPRNALSKPIYTTYKSNQLHPTVSREKSEGAERGASSAGVDTDDTEKIPPPRFLTMNFSHHYLNLFIGPS